MANGYDLEFKSGDSGSSAENANAAYQDMRNPIVIFLSKHWEMGFDASISVGAQGTVVIAPPPITKVSLAPYVKGLFGININIGSTVLFGASGNSKQGASLLTPADQIVKNGIGAALGGVGLDWQRISVGQSVTNTVSLSVAGMLSLQYNVTNSSWFVGFNPEAKFALFLGAEGSIYTGLKFP